MKYALILLAVMLIGCSSVKPVTPEIRYITKECPAPKTKPKFMKYELVKIKINGKSWYALQEPDALKAAVNWVSYKSWAEANAKLLEKKKSKTTK